MEGHDRRAFARKFAAPTRETVARARQHRKEPTVAERLLWEHLRGNRLGGFGFRRQYPVGGYILDFFCFEKGLAVELDGGPHSQQAEYDAERTRWLEAQGIQVLRFWDSRVVRDIEGVKKAILVTLTKLQ